LDVSNPSVNVGGSTTYTAALALGQTGPIVPSGSIEFLDGGTPIPSCAHRPPTQASGLFTASCTVDYSGAGSHSVTALYRGDDNFSRSASSPVQVSVTELPVQVLGTIESTMQWRFGYTPAYTKVLMLAVNEVPAGATVLVRCDGVGCPFAKRTTVVSKRARCQGRHKQKCNADAARTNNLTSAFHSHRLDVGASITVEIIRSGWIGKYYRFVVRARRAPRIQITCLAPGASRPGVGC
jgi:hypothetical protein